MSENKFEKAVQLEMQGFKIKPSEEVWLKVEERIRKKKKRRLFFILFFFGGLALLGYWQRHLLFNENKIPGSEPGITANDQEIKTNTVKINITGYSDKQYMVKKSREVNQPVIVSTDKIAASEKKKIITSVNRKEETENREIFTGVAKQEKHKTPIVQVMPKREAPEKSPVFADRIRKAVNTEEKSIVDKNIPDTIADIRFEKRVDQVIVNKVDSDSIQKTEEAVDLITEKKLPRDSIEKNEPATDTTAAPEKPLLKSKKWEWGVHITPGGSSLNEFLFSFNDAKSADYLSYPGNATGGGAVVLPAGPSESRNGFSFQAGAFIKKQISKHDFFSLGLQYTYYSEHIKVGSRRDSVLRYASQLSSLAGARYAYGAAAANNNINNRYHFIELPVIFHFQFKEKPAHPFYWNLGFTAGQFIAARALVYDTSFGGIYFDNKSRINKMQFSISAGFAWGFFSRKKMEWNIGPAVDIHLSRLMNSPPDRNKYLLFAGVRTAIIFPGKK